jgi:photosystem II stability/assembly factor-like uncharacterized protein
MRTYSSRWWHLLITCSALLLAGTLVRAQEDADLPPELVHQYVGAFFSDANHGVVYADDVIIATSDGGTTWSVAYEGPFTSLFLLDLQSFWFFARGVDLNATSDGGHYFTVHAQPTYLDPHSGEQEAVSGDLFFLNATDGWTVSVANVLRTHDSGATWQATALPRGVGESHKIRMFDSQSGIAVEPRHAVIRTTDGGTTWVPVANAPKLSLLSCTGAGFCAGVAGTHGPVFVSADRGQSWTDTQAPLDLPDRDSISQVQALSPTFVAVVGSHSEMSFQAGVRPFITSRTPLPEHGPPTGLLLTWDGTQWTRLTHDSPQRLRGVSFVSPQVGWLVSNRNNLIFKTSDGGHTLTFVPDYFRQIAPPTPTFPAAEPTETPTR